MPQVKKAPPPKSNLMRSKPVKLGYKLKPWHALAGLALFIAGGFIVAYSQAATENTAIIKSEPIIFYQDDDSATVIEKDNNSAILKQGPKIIQLSPNGELFCFEKSTDTGETRKMNPDDIAALLGELKSANLTQLPVPKIATGNVTAKSLTYIDPTTKRSIGINLQGSNNSTPAVAKAIDSLQKACKAHSKPTNRMMAPTVNKATSQSLTGAASIAKSLVGVAQAAEYANYNDTFNTTILNLIQTERHNRGLPAFIVHGCLNRSAADWSGRMAGRYNASMQTFGAPPGDYYIWHSVLAAEIEPFCGKQWTKLGENVGFDYAAATGKNPQQAAQSMFTNYMNSAPHRAAILGNTTYVGVGSMMTTNQTIILNTTHFASGTIYDLKAAPATK